MLGFCSLLSGNMLNFIVNHFIKPVKLVLNGIGDWQEYAVFIGLADKFSNEAC